MNISGKKLAKVFYYFIRDLFGVSFVLLFLLLMIEDFQPGFVSLWLEIKSFLIIVFILGILTLLFSRYKN
jgi:hypothetical protein